MMMYDKDDRMHEMSLINDLVHKLQDIARQYHVEKIVAVKVKLGALSHISAAHFREHFTRGVAGTVAAGARLDVELAHDMTDKDAQSLILDSIEVVS
jgi:hydrogenase nickel incorporation protein HypA/HybF